MSVNRKVRDDGKITESAGQVSCFSRGVTERDGREGVGIMQMAQADRPYEKCLRYGASHLSDEELLAAILRTGTSGMSAIALAREILATSSGDAGILSIHRLTLQKLKKIKGIGDVKAVQILCLSELAKRLAKADAGAGLIFSDPATIAEYYMEEMRHQSQEQMKLLMLNTKSGLIGERDISKGTVSASIITPRELFIEALNLEAVSIILLHNHPSGDPTPSECDINLTKRIKEAGDIIGITLLDHIIIGDNRFMSFKAMGIL